MPTSVIRGPFEFDLSVLTSALRLATIYDHPELRSFALGKLEKLSLSAVERVRFARDFDIPAWEEAAYVELCERDEAIGSAEASALGMDAFVQVARIREAEQRRKGEMVNSIKEAQSSDTQKNGQKAEPVILSPTSNLALGAAEVTAMTAALVVRDPGVSREENSDKVAKSQTYEKGEGKLCMG